MVVVVIVVVVAVVVVAVGAYCFTFPCLPVNRRHVGLRLQGQRQFVAATLQQRRTRTCSTAVRFFVFQCVCKSICFFLSLLVRIRLQPVFYWRDRPNNILRTVLAGR